MTGLVVRFVVLRKDLESVINSHFVGQWENYSICFGYFKFSVEKLGLAFKNSNG